MIQRDILRVGQCLVVGFELAGDRAVVQMEVVAGLRIGVRRPVTLVEPEGRPAIAVECRRQFGSAFRDTGDIAGPLEIAVCICLAKLEHQRRSTGLAATIRLHDKLGLIIDLRIAGEKRSGEQVLAHEAARRPVGQRLEGCAHRRDGAAERQSGSVGPLDNH